MKKIIKNVIIAGLLILSSVSNAEENKAVGYVGVATDELGYVRASVDYVDAQLSPGIFTLINPTIGYKYRKGKKGFNLGVATVPYYLSLEVSINAAVKAGRNDYKAIYQCGIEYKLNAHTSLQANYSYNQLSNSHDMSISEFGFGIVAKF